MLGLGGNHSSPKELCTQKRVSSKDLRPRILGYIEISSFSGSLALPYVVNHPDKINMERAMYYTVCCENVAGGFACTPGAASLAGQSIIYVTLQFFTKF
ncbi:hypothetical protein SADUNF_Sadunf13G0117800 [Salix dunnii]|uniref:Uncharacterized protein n=1 Tax=Salix dunnii TaxID=1413687 RepID=A0A835JKF3_9ROSI|nr:hypothetical protein SADUNF_Sadunf13G0117800 [Salix dunnii]